MGRLCRFSVLAAAALWCGVLLLQFLPVLSFLHEVSEHGALEVSDCACLVCHLSVHTPAESVEQTVAIGGGSDLSGVLTPESPTAPVWRLDASVPGRSPPIHC